MAPSPDSPRSSHGKLRASPPSSSSDSEDDFHTRYGGRIALDDDFTQFLPIGSSSKRPESDDMSQVKHRRKAARDRLVQLRLRNESKTGGDAVTPIGSAALGLGGATVKSNPSLSMGLTSSLTLGTTATATSSTTMLGGSSAAGASSLTTGVESGNGAAAAEKPAELPITQLIPKALNVLNMRQLEGLDDENSEDDEYVIYRPPWLPEWFPDHAIRYTPTFFLNFFSWRRLKYLWHKFWPLLVLSVVMALSALLCMSLLRIRGVSYIVSTPFRIMFDIIFEDIGMGFLLVYSLWLAYPDVVGIQRIRNIFIYAAFVILVLVFLYLKELYHPITSKLDSGLAEIDTNDTISANSTTNGTTTETSFETLQWNVVQWAYNFALGLGTFVILPLIFRKEIKRLLIIERSINPTLYSPPPNRIDWLEILCYCVIIGTNVTEILRIFVGVDLFPGILIFFIPAIYIIFRDWDKQFQREYSYVLLSSLSQFVMRPINRATLEVALASAKTIESVVSKDSSWSMAFKRLMAMLFYYSCVAIIFPIAYRTFQCSTTPQKREHIHVRYFILQFYQVRNPGDILLFAPPFCFWKMLWINCGAMVFFCF
jgi:hypothetical protein